MQLPADATIYYRLPRRLKVMESTFEVVRDKPRQRVNGKKVYTFDFGSPMVKVPNA